MKNVQTENTVYKTASLDLDWLYNLVLLFGCGVSSPVSSHACLGQRSQLKNF